MNLKKKKVEFVIAYVMHAVVIKYTAYLLPSIVCSEGKCQRNCFKAYFLPSITAEPASLV